MELRFKLLEHPFYQSWTKGEITIPQLSIYAAAYTEFIDCVPHLWQRVTDNLGVNGAEAKAIIAEEKEHVNLWRLWSDKLPQAESNPGMKDIVDGFEKMTDSELAGAIHAFEIQQPEVAKTKKEGLINFYGFSEADAKYFDEHMNEAEHIVFGNRIYREASDKEEFERGFDKGAELVYKGLDRFLS